MFKMFPSCYIDFNIKILISMFLPYSMLPHSNTAVVINIAVFYKRFNY